VNQLLVVDTLQDIPIEYTEIIHARTHNHDLYILEQPSSCSTSWIHPSWPRCRLRLSLLLVSLSEHASCHHAQPSILLFISMGWITHLTPSLLSGRLLSSVQVNNNNVTWHTCIHHIGITILLFFLHFFRSLWQAGWFRPFPSDTVIVNNKTMTSYDARGKNSKRSSRVLIYFTDPSIQSNTPSLLVKWGWRSSHVPRNDNLYLIIVKMSSNYRYCINLAHMHNIHVPLCVKMTFVFCIKIVVYQIVIRRGQSARIGHSKTSKELTKLLGWVESGNGMCGSLGLDWTGTFVRARFNLPSKQISFFIFLFLLNGIVQRIQRGVNNKLK
jgi:hypothetical protein